MHHLKQFQVPDDDAASEIIGTLILIALIAGALTIFGTVLLSQPAPDNVPAVTIVITNESRSVRLYHNGGNSVPTKDLAININGNLVAFSGAGSDNTWSVGETLTAVSPALPQKVTVVYSGGSGQIVLGSGAPETR